MPSPADLARARPRPAPPRESQPQRPGARQVGGRRATEVEKERARRALRALVADPATDFAALGADEFSAVLRSAREGGVPNVALVADTTRRITAGSAAPRDLHQVLFSPGAGQGADATADPAWEGARAVAMAAIAGRPHLAVEVIAMEAQRLGCPGIQLAESVSAGGFTATASVERHGDLIAGEPCTAGGKKAARQDAAVSLLSVLVGIGVPVPRAAAAAAGRDPGAGVPSASAASPMSVADVEAWLDYEVSRPVPDAEFAAGVTGGNLSSRSVYLLLFEADPGGWAAYRDAAWRALTASPAAAPGVLSLYTQSRELPPASYAEPDTGTAVAFLVTPDGPVVGEPAVAASQKAARAAAALTLVRDLAPPVGQPPGHAGDAGPAGNPVGALNERAQAGVITGLSYAQSAAGPAHRPLFTCVATCTYAAQTCACEAEGGSKNEAKAAAAAGLLDQVVAMEADTAGILARAHRAEARSAQGIFGRLLRAGHGAEFDPGRGLRVSDDLPAPLAGWSVPLLVALPVLAGLAGNAAVPGDRPAPHPSAARLAAAARAALAAVAARRVYPALDDEGRDCWRIAPAAGVPAQFGDAVANALLRPPGARLVLGDVPYVGRPRPLDAGGAEWADRVADAVEGAVPVPVSIRVSPPEADGLPLRARIYASRLGHAEHRLLRRAARDWPPLAGVVAGQPLSAAQAAELLGDAAEKLAAHQVTVEWPADLTLPGGPRGAAGPRDAGLRVSVAVRSAATEGYFSLAGAAESSWQLALDGEPLLDEETAAVAAAVDGVLRLRGRWVVVLPETRQRAAAPAIAGRLSGAQALSAALTGQVTIGGGEFACSAVGRLTGLVSELRRAAEPAGADGGTRDSTEPLAIDGLRATLRGYQQRAVSWLERTTALGFGALLADDMGLGKTLTCIAFHLARQGSGPALVVCPASLLANWEREFARFAPGVTVRRYHGGGRSLGGLAASSAAGAASGPGEVVVTTYGTLLRDAGKLAGVPWDLVVADEAQQVKNHRSQAARALRELRPRARVAVTGTPVENSLSELWAILDWANPGLLGSLPAFRDRYGRAAERAAGTGAGGGRPGTRDPGTADAGGTDAARRLGRLIAPFTLRRRKTDPGIAPELPDKVVSDRYVQLSAEQAALYREVAARSLGAVTASGGIERRGQVLRLLQSLRQVCNSPAHFLRESAAGWDADAQAGRSAKLQALDELMESIASTGDSALIFTGYVSMGNLILAHLAARGIAAQFLHGALPVARRQRIVDTFQAGTGTALVLSVRAAGTGLNLTRAGHVIHFDRPWNPAVEDQATDRAHRIGQHRLVEVHHLIAEGTVEDRIADLLASKRGLTEAVLAGGEVALTELSDGELRALVSLGKDQGEP